MSPAADVGDLAHEELLAALLAQHAVLHRALGADEAVHVHGPPLAEAVRARQRLLVEARVPAHVEEDDAARADEVDALAACLDRHEQHVDAVVVVVVRHTGDTTGSSERRCCGRRTKRRPGRGSPRLGREDALALARRRPRGVDGRSRRRRSSTSVVVARVPTSRRLLGAASRAFVEGVDDGGAARGRRRAVDAPMPHAHAPGMRGVARGDEPFERVERAEGLREEDDAVAAFRRFDENPERDGRLARPARPVGLARDVASRSEGRLR
mmetsp:Transcript_5152/g.21182  ORF Transcript_5152/g.21182 Transcript_5152/m.21182 type:complete len:268 (-) Transcript_5152:1276-2079(-)